MCQAQKKNIGLSYMESKSKKIRVIWHDSKGKVLARKWRMTEPERKRGTKINHYEGSTMCMNESSIMNPLKTVKKSWCSGSNSRSPA
jgi:hypothetical protein